MRVAVIENMKSTPLGSLGTALTEANAEIEHFRPWIDGKLPTGSADHDALASRTQSMTRTIPICHHLRS